MREALHSPSLPSRRSEWGKIRLLHGQGIFDPPHFFETPDSAHHAKCFAWLQIRFLDCGMNVISGKRAVTPEGDGPDKSILLFTCLFTAALACQRFFHPLFFAGLQVKGV